MATTTGAETAPSWREGHRVRLRDRTWTIARLAAGDDCQALTLVSADGELPLRRTFLVPFDRPQLVAPPHEVRVVTRRRAMARLAALCAAPASLDAPRALVTARADVLPWQIAPTVALLRGVANRVLIADHVGLGKTIQAAMAIAELHARGFCRRALIVVPAGLRAQWSGELAGRFQLQPVVADAAWLATRAAELPPEVSPWAADGIFIVSLDFVKRYEVLQGLQDVGWDLLVVDEAHLATSASDRARAVHALGRRSLRVILLTATPHAGSADEFAALCGIGAFSKTDPLAIFRRTRAAVDTPGSVEPRQGRPDRRMRTIVVRVRSTIAERQMHDALGRYARAVLAELGQPDGSGVRLALQVLQKRALSSAWALARTLERRLELLSNRTGLERDQPRLPFDDVAAEDAALPAALDAPGLANRRRETAWLRTLIATARRAAARSSKLAVLERLLARTREPLVVFTEYRDTLHWIAHHVSPRHACDVLHGGLGPEDRHAVVLRFEHGPTRLLLATDAAGVGLNLQARCRWVMNFELPWNPNRLEQRGGRVDRIGQRRRVHVHHLVGSGTAEERLLRRLVGRVADIREAIGDAGAMLGAWTQQENAIGDADEAVIGTADEHQRAAPALDRPGAGTPASDGVAARATGAQPGGTAAPVWPALDAECRAAAEEVLLARRVRGRVRDTRIAGEDARVVVAMVRRRYSRGSYRPALPPALYCICRCALRNDTGGLLTAHSLVLTIAPPIAWPRPDRPARAVQPRHAEVTSRGRKAHRRELVDLVHAVRPWLEQQAATRVAAWERDTRAGLLSASAALRARYTLIARAARERLAAGLAQPQLFESRASTAVARPEVDVTMPELPCLTPGRLETTVRLLLEVQGPPRHLAVQP